MPTSKETRFQVERVYEKKHLMTDKYSEYCFDKIWNGLSFFFLYHPSFCKIFIIPLENSCQLEF